MKMIQVFGDGGIYASVTNPFSLQAQQDMTPQAEAASVKAAKPEKLISESVLNQLSRTGLPNEVNRFMTMLADFEEETDRDAMFGRGINKRKLYALKAYANQIIQQAAYLKKAEDNAINNDAWDEVAVDNRGYFYTINDNGAVEKVHMSHYDAGKQYALSVGELIERRKFGQDTVDNAGITTAISSSIGLSKINEYIQDIIKAVGTSTNSTEAYHDLATVIGADLAKRPTEEQMQALQQLYGWADKVGLDAIFKTKDEVSSKNMEVAMKYIYSVLPNNMRTQLEGRYVAGGGKYTDSGKYAMSLIELAAAAGNTTKYVHGLDYDASINKGAGTKAGTNEINPQRTNLNVLESLVQGTLGKRDYKLVSSKNPEMSVTLHGTGVGALANFNNNIVPKTPVSVALQEALGPLVDVNHIFMGNQKISAGSLDSILYDGADVINVWAPIDSNGDIDFAGLQIFNELQQYFDNDPSISTQEKNNLLAQYGVQGYYDESGTFHGSGNMGQFLVFTGVTSDEVIDPSENIYADKLSKDEKKFEMDQIDRIYGNLNAKVKDSGGKYEFKKGFFTTDIVKAPIFMRLNATAQIDVGTFSDHGPTVNTRTYGEQVAYDQMRYNQSRQVQLTKPSTSLLYGNE